MLTLVLFVALAQQSGVPSRAGSSSGSGSAAVSPNAPPGFSVGFPQTCVVPIPTQNGFSGSPGEFSMAYSTWSGGAGPTPTLGSGRTRSGRGTIGTSVADLSSATVQTGYSYVARGPSVEIGGFSWWSRFSKITPAFNGGVAWHNGLGGYAQFGINCERPTTRRFDGMMFLCEDGGMQKVHLCSCNDAGRSCTDTGANFPCGQHALGDAGFEMFYDVTLTAPPAVESVSYTIKNLTTGAEGGGVITQNLPRNTVMLQWDMGLCNVDSGVAQTMEFMTSCFNDYSLAPVTTVPAVDGGSVALDSGIVAYYAMEDGGLSSTGSYNATFTGASLVTNVDAGKIGLGLNSTAITGTHYFAPTAAPTYVSSVPYSISMWVQPRAFTATYQKLFGNNFNVGWYVFGDAGVRMFSGSAYDAIPQTALTGNVWTHVAVTHNGSWSYLYINGVKTAAVTLAYSFTLQSIANSTGTQPFYGFIDEVGMWDRELSPNEVAALYNGGAGLQYPF
jgi:hypothetical protein